MKYDEFEKTECSNYPNTDVLVEESSKPKRDIFKRLRGNNSIVSYVACCAVMSCVLLFTSVIAIAITGNLGLIFS